ncbi:MAG: hypothetical protein ABIB61_04740 [Candidatus Shapirobacteria bacterium]
MSKRRKLFLCFPVFLFLITNLLYSSYFVAAGQPTPNTIEGGQVLSATDQKIAAACHSTTYLPLGNNSSTLSLGWETLAGSEFYFDLKNYPASAKIYWEGNLKTFSVNSRCFARIYDKTHFREVDYSQISTDQTVYHNLISQSLSVWPGNNQYEVQIKSLNGIECYLISPRLIIKY